MSDARQGLADIQQKLTHLAGKGSAKILRSGVGAGMTSLVQSLRAAVNATAAPNDVKRAARKWIGKRYAKGGTNRMGKTTQAAAKVGFGVGFKKAARKQAATKHAGSGKKGVGLSASNIHWFVLGTVQRKLKKGSTKGPKAGHPTGSIPSFLFGSTKMATEYGGPIALEAARTKITELLAREAQTKG
jgi:hypothetical protein